MTSRARINSRKLTQKYWNDAAVQVGTKGNQKGLKDSKFRNFSIFLMGLLFICYNVFLGRNPDAEQIQKQQSQTTPAAQNSAAKPSPAQSAAAAAAAAATPPADVAESYKASTTSIVVPKVYCRNKSPPAEATSTLPLSEVHDYIAKAVSHAEKFNKGDIIFHDLGRSLYNVAVQKKKMLVTLQIGPMDGKTVNQLSNMFVRDFGEEPLMHWFPVAAEALVYNFDKMKEWYDEIHEKRQLACQALNLVPIAPKTETCFFYYADRTKCPDMEHWMQNAMGTLDAEMASALIGGYLGDRFDKCVTKQSRNCVSVQRLWDELKLPHDITAILDVNVFGYEVEIIMSLLNTLPDAAKPPIIFFATHQLKESDRRNGTNMHQNLLDFLKLHGYAIFHSDSLALKIRPFALPKS